MSNGMRPGGLTALAVMNFAFAAFMALRSLNWLTMILILADAFPIPMGGGDSEQSREMARQMELVREWFNEAGGIPLVIALAGLCFVQAALLITSGIGYLKQKKLLGHVLGNVYVATAVLYVALVVGCVPKELGGFNLMTMIALIYPVLTLVVLNTTFRRDFGS